MCVDIRETARPEGASTGTAHGERGLSSIHTGGPVHLHKRERCVNSTAQSADPSALGGTAGGAGGDQDLSGVGPTGDIPSGPPVLGRVPASQGGPGGTEGHCVGEGRGGAESAIGAREYKNIIGALGETRGETRALPPLYRS